MRKVIVIVGATATKKSELAIKLAGDLNAEIINADCFQIYKELNIGINKKMIDTNLGIKQHFINSHSIYDEFNIKTFQNLARDKINQIADKNIIICGGSNLYIESLIKNYNLDKSDDRKNIIYFKDKTYEEIYDYLYKNDPEEAIKININNKRRIIRAAQLFFDTNKTKKEQNLNNGYYYDCYIINTVLERKELYDKINQRVDKMIANNWKKEVFELIEKDENIINLQAFKAIGYKQVYDSIRYNNNIDNGEIKMLTRRFAKRQITWNKRYESNNVNVDDFNYENLLQSLKEFLNK